MIIKTIEEYKRIVSKKALGLPLTKEEQYFIDNFMKQ